MTQDQKIKYEVNIINNSSDRRERCYEFNTRCEAISFAEKTIKLKSVSEVIIYDGDRVVKVFI